MKTIYVSRSEEAARWVASLSLTKRIFLKNKLYLTRCRDCFRKFTSCDENLCLMKATKGAKNGNDE